MLSAPTQSVGIVSEYDAGQVPPCGPQCRLKHLWIRSQNGQVPSHPRLGDEHASVDQGTRKEVNQKLYTPLAVDQIRLLSISPDKPGAPVQAKLEIATLTYLRRARIQTELSSHYVPYSTLSYSWGKPNFTCSIQCNGVSFPVTRHLRDALRRVRSETDHVYIWVDALCINQFDLLEKASQIQMMFYIFQYADVNVCWLGEALSVYEQLLTILSITSKEFDAIHKDKMLDEDCRKYLIEMAEKLIGFINGNAWFRRAWVRQEVYASRRLDLVYGSSHITFDMLAHVSQAILHHITPAFRTLVGDVLRGFSYKTQGEWVQETYDIFTKTWDHDWLHLALSTAAGFEATLDHDRIFALQNIAEPGNVPENRLIPSMNYNLEASEIYTKFMRSLIMEHRRINALSVFENHNMQAADQRPSWVPNFKINQPRFVLKDTAFSRRWTTMDTEKYQDEYEAQWALTKARSSSMYDWRCLSLTGLRIGEIGKERGMMDPDLDDLIQFETINSFGFVSAEGATNAAGTETSSARSAGEWGAALEQVAYSNFDFEMDMRLPSNDVAAVPEPANDDPDAKPTKKAKAARYYIMATSAAEEGDIVVAFRGTSIDEPMLIHLVRPLPFSKAYQQTFAAKYRFLGPCLPFQAKKRARDPTEKKKKHKSEAFGGALGMDPSRRLHIVPAQAIIEEIREQLETVGDINFEEFILV